MTIRDPNLERPLNRPDVPPENRQDVVPAGERNQDPLRDEAERGLTLEGSRPLTHAEQTAAEHDTPVGERVYAPASERVPVQPVPGHRDFVEHPDTHTPEREAVSHTPASSASGSEPSFTRMPRPGSSTTETPTPGAYASAQSNPGFRTDETDDWSSWPTHNRGKMFFGIGFSWFAAIGGGLGLWWFMRWRKERNKPINRFRRQALQAATELRQRVPNAEDAAKPAMGVTSALVPLLVLMWQQTQTRSKKGTRRLGRQTARLSHRADKAFSRAGDAVSDHDWQQRLIKLKERWTPGRVEMEKVTISRH